MARTRRPRASFAAKRAGYKARTNRRYAKQYARMDKSKAVRRATVGAQYALGAYSAMTGRTKATRLMGAGVVGMTLLHQRQAKKMGSYTKAHQKRVANRKYINGLGKPHGQHAKGVATRRRNRTRRDYKGQFAGSR